MTMTYGQRRDALQAAISATLPEDDDDDYGTYVYVVDFSDTFVVYEVGWSEYFEDDYTMDAAGNVTLAGKPEAVKSITTFVPLEAEAQGIVNIERRDRIQGIRGSTTIKAEPIRFNPEVPTVKVKSEPLTYHRHSRSSYFQDLLMKDKYPEPAARMERHAAEMRVIHAEREERTWSSIRSGGFEYRVEPNRTDGQGGYFSPPLWINQYFATGVRAKRVLAGLIPGFDLPDGVSQINLPIIGTGTKVRHSIDTGGVADVDFTDAAGSSTVATLVGTADVSLQSLEQSPAGAHLDWALALDLAEDYDRSVESQLLVGNGAAYSELLGVVNADTAITYTDASPTAAKMWPFFGQAAAQIGDARDVPPEVWLMRTARWSWLNVQEDTAGRPFGISSPFFLGSDDKTPDPAGGLISWPVFLDDAIPANLGVGQNQDEIICLRPTDLMLLEGTPTTTVMREVLSGTLGARIQMHNKVAAMTNRYVSGITVVIGTGMVVQSGF